MFLMTLEEPRCGERLQNIGEAQVSKLDDNKATYPRQIDRIEREISDADGAGESERLAQLKEALRIEQRLLERLGE